ncbi:putative LOC101896122 [Trichonephila clavipes]|nr:putative LOC101896122 [Trichonephila clavipes]
MGLQFLFMDDNAPRYRTVAAEQLLENEDMERMDWPARSPDLNPIEHVWDFLGRRLAARTLPPVTIRELRLALYISRVFMSQTVWLQVLTRPPYNKHNVIIGAKKVGYITSQNRSPLRSLIELLFWYQYITNVNGWESPSRAFGTKLSMKFVEWAQNEIAVVPDFHKRILFSDEAHFWLNGYVNKQNCRIWSEANPQVYVYVETPLHPEKLTVWGALWAGGIIGSYFFKNNEGHNVTVNGDRYRAMITNFFISELNNHDVQELWFQQDGATFHTARATIDLLKDSLVYSDKPQMLDHLEDNIRRVIADIRPQMLEKVIENWTSRLDYIRASRSSPMPEIIFKM